MLAVRHVFNSLLALTFASIHPAVAHAGQRGQDESKAQAQEVAPAPIPPSDIARRTEETRLTIGAMRAEFTSTEAVAGIIAQLDSLAEISAQLKSDPGSVNPAGLATRRLDNLKLRWSNFKNQLDRSRGALANRTARLESARDTVRSLRRIWIATTESADSLLLPEAALNQIAVLLVTLDSAGSELQLRLDSALTLKIRITEESIAATEVLTQIDRAAVEARQQLFYPDRPPLWGELVDPPSRQMIGSGLRESWDENINTISEYLQARREEVIVYLVVFAALLLLMIGLRRRTGELVKEDPAFSAAAHTLDRPLSAALLVSLLVTRPLVPGAPIIVLDLIKLLTLVPVLRLVPGLLVPGLRGPLYGLTALYFLDIAYDFAPDGSLPQRMILLFVAVASLLAIAWLVRPGGRLESSGDGRWWRAAQAISRLALLVLGVAVVANVFGYVRLAGLLTWETLTTGYLALVIFAAAQVVAGLVRVGLHTDFARSLNAVRKHYWLLTRRGVAFVELIAVLGWSYSVLNRFGILDPLVNLVWGVLTRDLAFGTLKISLGDLLIFAVTLWLALLAARFIRFILEEDVLPRIHLPRGVPSAISRLATYTILGIGFFIALAAAGISLDRFALIAGALGVGIGFGLQNIVNNFISGLILIFERPIQVGDTIQIGSSDGSTIGNVRRIGIRSSTVKTFEGAEVIVPNANLISAEVINWTLSDRQRRIEVNVGVAYGTDPRRVLELLNAVGTAHPDVLETPEPAVFFRGFGASSLDFSLRVWTRDFENWWRVSSEVTVAVNDAIKEAGIEIPFPQRDLHIRSVDSNAVREKIEEAVAGSDGEGSV